MLEPVLPGVGGSDVTLPETVLDVVKTIELPLPVPVVIVTLPVYLDKLVPMLPVPRRVDVVDLEDSVPVSVDVDTVPGVLVSDPVPVEDPEVGLTVVELNEAPPLVSVGILRPPE